MKVEFEMKQVLRILSRACLFFVGFVFATLSAAQSPCIDGFADGYPCDRIDLLSQMSNETLMGTGSNDIWGWEDPITHVEYALVGEREGLSIVDLSDPVNPF
jgi:hypothetical protein